MEERKLTFEERILKVQEELKAPKGQYNSFGKYKYRSCEDILEAVKPLLVKYELILHIFDTLEYIGNRYYIKATAVISGLDGKSLENTAFAREEETKKGMDGSQITGTSSSYARKYALNGLFLIDDTKDADTDEFKQQQDKHTKGTKNNEIETLKTQIKAYGMNASEKLKAKGVKLSQLTTEQMKQLLEELKNEEH